MKNSVLSQPLSQQHWPADATPVVSVLVLAYNQERFLAECLDGILQQVTDFPVEVIVHDDASSDGTAQVITDYARQYPALIKPVLQKENQVSQHRKIRPLLMAQVRGEFVANCDGDDVWLDPGKLAKQVGFLRAHREYVLSYHGSVRVDEAGRRLDAAGKRKKPGHDSTAAELRELKWGFILLGTLMYRNVPIEFPPEYGLVPNGDNFLPMLLAAHGGAKFQEEVGPLAYRQHGGGMWSPKPKPEQLRMHLRSYLQIAAYFVRIGEVETAKKIMSGRLAHHGMRYFDLNYLQLAKHCLLAGLAKPVKKTLARHLGRFWRKPGA